MIDRNESTNSSRRSSFIIDFFLRQDDFETANYPFNYQNEIIYENGLYHEEDIEWGDLDPAEFQKLFSGELDTTSTERFVMEMIKDTSDENFQSSRKIFWELIFKNKVHRRTFQNRDMSLIHLLVKSANSGVLELLLQYEPNLRQTSAKGNSALHYLCRRQWKASQEKSFVRCMELLMNHDEIDVNALNDRLETPMDVAINKENEHAVIMLLQANSKVYLGDYLGFDEKPPIRERIQMIFRDLNLPDYGDDDLIILPSKLHYYLRNKDILRFTSEFSSAINKGRFPYVNLSHKLMIYLQEATKQGLENVVDLLLMYDADPSARDKWNDSRSAITVAIENNSIDILKRLLDRTRLKNLKLGHAKEACSTINVREVNTGNTALHYAAQYGNETAMLEILDSGGFIGVKNDRNDIPLTRIPASVLKQFLDKKIIKRPTKTNDVQGVQFDFDCKFLIGNKQEVTEKTGYPSVMLLKKIKENPEQRHLLKHPVLASFALKKWEKMRIIFLINLIFYLSLSVLIAFNTVWVSLYNTHYLDGTRLAQGMLLIILLSREVFQAVIQKGHYFGQFENYLELSIAAIGGYLTIITCDESSRDIFRHLGAVLVLNSAIGLLLLLGKHPLFSVQLEMFQLVISSFIKFASLYITIIVGFALAFFVLFSECSSLNEFSVLTGSIFKTIIMISGEFDASDMPFYVYPITSHIIFVLFVFLIAIVLLNLLNGIAVYDTQKIKEDATLHTYLSRVQYLAALDELILGLPEKLRFFEGFFEIDDYLISFDINITERDGKAATYFNNLKEKVKNYFNVVTGWDITQNAYQIVEENAKSEKLQNVSLGNNLETV